MRADDDVMDKRRYLWLGAIIISTLAAMQLTACGSEGAGVVPRLDSVDAASSVLSTASTLRAAPTPATGPSPTPKIWILQGPGLEAAAMAKDPEGIKFFSNPSRTVMYPVIADVSAPSSWKTILWQKYDSFAAFQSDIANGVVPLGTKVVGYDDEAWPATPVGEQNDPIGYTIKFAQLAHAHGYKMISMPAEDLMHGLSQGETKFTAFINYGMAKAVAPYVNYYHLQAQDLEVTPAAYVSYVKTIVAQVHGANPDVIVTGGVATASPETAAEIDATIEASRELLSGYWFNIVGQTTPIASEALTNLH